MSERSVPPEQIKSMMDKIASELKEEWKKSLSNLKTELKNEICYELKTSLGQAMIHGLERMIVEFQDMLSLTEDIAYKGRKVGRLNWIGYGATFIPSVDVKAEDPAISEFLAKRVLEKMKEKHGFVYKIMADEKGLLTQVKVEGELRDRHVKEMENAVAWAFAAAAGLITEQPKTDILERAERMFPNELIDKISLELSDSHVIIKPKQYLGKNLFIELAEIVRDKLGGEYVSAGRDSHFRIPIEAMQK